MALEGLLEMFSVPDAEARTGFEGACVDGVEQAAAVHKPAANNVISSLKMVLSLLDGSEITPVIYL